MIVPGAIRSPRLRRAPSRRALAGCLAGSWLLLLGAAAAGEARAAVQPFILGRMLRQAKVQGYFVHYHLLDRGERDLLVDGLEIREAPGIDATGRATHHLMVYLWGRDGRLLPSAKVSLRFTGPDGRTWTTPTATMQGGHGADVVLPTAGDYAVSMSADLGATTLTDTFTFGFK